MNTKTRATIEDLYRLPHDGKYELVNGELHHMPPTSGEHGDIGTEIAVELRLYQRRGNVGRALGDNVGYILDTVRRTVLSPDASYTFPAQLISQKFITGGPLFAVEIRSPGDYGSQMDDEYATKRQLYFDAGTHVIWNVNPRDRTVTKYTSDRPEYPTVYEMGDVADAEPALPGWRVAVHGLFPAR